jgi:hypothetical protein
MSWKDMKRGEHDETKFEIEATAKFLSDLLTRDIKLYSQTSICQTWNEGRGIDI